MCGKPALGETGTEPRCLECRQKYVSFACTHCGKQVTVYRTNATNDRCLSCMIRLQLSALSSDQRRRLRQLSVNITLSGLREAAEILREYLDAELPLYELRGISDEDK